MTDPQTTADTEPDLTADEKLLLAGVFAHLMGVRR